VENKYLKLSKPPLNILTNPDEIRRKKPWEIDLDQLLEVFIKVLENDEIPDLRICGSAVLSSALIYRLKVESLFLFEKYQVKRHIDRSELSPIIEFPFRYELSATSLDDLVSVLESVLEEILSKPQKKSKISIIEPEPILEVDPFSTQLQTALDKLKKEISSILTINRAIYFSDYVKEMNIIAKMRTFLLILFAANDGLIKLIQEQDDIRIVRGKSDIPR
jgi:segregation and condensation protein A